MKSNEIGQHFLPTFLQLTFRDKHSDIYLSNCEVPYLVNLGKVYKLINFKWTSTTRQVVDCAVH